MLNINLKARLGNKTFWISLISTLALLLQQCGLDVSKLIPSNYVDIINTVFAILAMLGIVVDTSTPGISDSNVNASTTYVTPDQVAQTASDNSTSDSSNTTDNSNSTQTDTSNISNAITEVSTNPNIQIDSNSTQVSTDSTDEDIKNAIVVNSTITPKANTADDINANA